VIEGLGWGERWGGEIYERISRNFQEIYPMLWEISEKFGKFL